VLCLVASTKCLLAASVGFVVVPDGLAVLLSIGRYSRR